MYQRPAVARYLDVKTGAVIPGYDGVSQLHRVMIKLNVVGRSERVILFLVDMANEQLILSVLGAECDSILTQQAGAYK